VQAVCSPTSILRSPNVHVKSVLHINTEALAFCRWLNEGLQVTGYKLQVWHGDQLETCNLPFGTCQVRLPTESEWEKAARGTEARIFPWGNEIDPARANYGDAGLGTTTAVGCFPAGASPYGLLDLSGNVEEWCQTVWLDNYEGYAQKVIQSTEVEGPRVLRGGAFSYSAQVVRCACRYHYEPSNWNHDVGFRVCVAPRVDSGWLS